MVFDEVGSQPPVQDALVLDRLHKLLRGHLVVNNAIERSRHHGSDEWRTFEDNVSVPVLLISSQKSAERVIVRGLAHFVEEWLPILIILSPHEFRGGNFRDHQSLGIGLRDGSSDSTQQL